MKIRIQGNSVRFRLSRTEVEKLCSRGQIEDATSFGATSFSYAIRSDDQTEHLKASFSGQQITLFVPEYLLKDWSDNQVVGFDANMPLDA
ncbi:MAG TPA: hypothetical protein VGN64_16650, partial [Dyadobacter sp.]|nr:hypothetical protein [Dyadobacter sp.]